MSLSTGQKIGIIVVILIIVFVALFFIFYNPDKEDDDTTSSDKTSNTSSRSGRTDQVDLGPYSVLGMSGYYTVDSFKNNKLWKDTSPRFNDIKDDNMRGNVHVSNNFVVGTVSDGFKLPLTAIGDDYTLFFLAQYSGPNKKQLISGIDIGTQNKTIYGMEQSNGRTRLNGVEISNPFNLKIQADSNNVVSVSFNNIPTYFTLPKTTLPQSNNFNIIINKYGESEINTVANVSTLSNVLSRELSTENFNVVDGTDKIVLRQPKIPAVNFEGDENKYSDFAFKEIIVYSRTLGNEHINRIERHFRTKYADLFNTVTGVKANTNITTATLNVWSEDTCREYASNASANAFAFNLQAQQCYIYNDALELVNWVGDYNNYDTVSMCTDPLKTISSGCLQYGMTPFPDSTEQGEIPDQIDIPLLPDEGEVFQSQPTQAR